jgi:inward rectifier potassium channel
VFIAFNEVFALFYAIGDQPIANVRGSAYLDYLYFSIETLSTAGYGDMHPQTHYGHFIAAVELFTGIFSMSLMTGLIFARFSRPSARLLFADHPVISNHEGKPTLMLRLANERHNIIGNASARLWLLKNVVSVEGQLFRRFYELPLVRNEHPALALSWTLYHVLDENSPLYGQTPEDLNACNVLLVAVVSGYDVVAAQTIHARRHTTIPIFCLAIPTPISSARWRTAGSGSTTAGFTILYRDRLALPFMPTFYGHAPRAC